MICFFNAEVFDGKCPDGFHGYVVVEGERIKEVGCGAPPEGFAGQLVDVGGKVLCPGFIDSHSHNDFYAGREDNEKYFAPMLEQGITTMVAGNCGFSATGFLPETPHHETLGGLFPYNPDYKEWAPFENFAALVDAHCPVNMATLVGHGTIRKSIRGLGPGAYTKEEQALADSLLRTALEQGAAGVSFGLMYDPDMFVPKEELIHAAKIAKEMGRPITFHMRACSAISTSYDSLFGRAHNLRALDEAIEIAAKSGAKCHLSHIIFVGKSSWKTLDETLHIINRANAAGMDVSFDIYSSDFGASCINVILPGWYQGMSAEQKKKLLTRIRLNAMIFGAKKLLGVGFDDLEITYAGPDHSEYIGKRVSQIAKEKGKGGLATYLEIIDQTNAEASIHMYKYMNEHIIDTLSRHDRVMMMTDAWIKDEGTQNAAAYGSFPKFLRLSREGKAENLGRLICKMTSAAAERFALKERGVLKAGNYADLVVFDKDTVKENGCAAPDGICHVMVSGSFAVQDGKRTAASSGKAICVGK
ncbi:MAG: amidohydrolase family protein [Christensenellaceae bacterium]|nr:amidohydrolase family protein [Christensenellaceae bacterium]